MDTNLHSRSDLKYTVIMIHKKTNTTKIIHKR